jgi:hypothetical protein
VGPDKVPIKRSHDQPTVIIYPATSTPEEIALWATPTGVGIVATGTARQSVVGALASNIGQLATKEEFEELKDQFDKLLDRLGPMHGLGPMNCPVTQSTVAQKKKQKKQSLTHMPVEEEVNGVFFDVNA